MLKVKKVVVDKEIILPNGKLLMCDYKWTWKSKFQRQRAEVIIYMIEIHIYFT